MISKNVQFTASQVQTDSAGQYVIVVGKLYSLPVILACIYAPNWDDPSFFTNFFSHLPDMTSHHLKLGGDINCALSPLLDRSISIVLITFFWIKEFCISQKNVITGLWSSRIMVP